MSTSVNDCLSIPRTLLKHRKGISASSGRPVRSGLSRWQAINNLKMSTCAILLDRLAEDTLGITTQCPGISSGRVTLDPVQAWELCRDAMIGSIPLLAPFAEQICTETPKCLQPKNPIIRESFTCDRGFNRTPFVYVDYQYSSRSLVTLAREFGRAVQIVASDHHSTRHSSAPVVRECCGFIAELCLIHYAQHYAPELFPGLVSVWVGDNASCLVMNAESLRRAFAKHCTDDDYGDDNYRDDNYIDSDYRDSIFHDTAYDANDYDYSWNYPLARAWSCLLWRERWDFLNRPFIANPALSNGPWSLEHVLAASMSSPRHMPVEWGI